MIPIGTVSPVVDNAESGDYSGKGASNPSDCPQKCGAFSLAPEVLARAGLTYRAFRSRTRVEGREHAIGNHPAIGSKSQQHFPSATEEGVCRASLAALDILF